MHSSNSLTSFKSQLHGIQTLSQSSDDLGNIGKARIARSLLHLRIQRDPTFKYICLKITGRELINLPPELFEITSLEYLVLSPERESDLMIRLLEVPRAIARLNQLKILCLDTNELTKIPAEIGNLKKLERLVLSNNLLTTMPSSLSDLQNLKHLHIANNYFKSIPNCVYSMLNLEFLDASDNKITRLSHDIGALVALETLLLFYNLLETVPDTITKCTNLRNLWLGNNRLRYLPENFGDLTKVDWEFHPNPANINGNPNLKRPPVEVCVQGPDVISDYFNQGQPRRSNRQRQRYEDNSGESGHGSSETSSPLLMSSSEWSDVLDIAENGKK